MVEDLNNWIEVADSNFWSPENKEDEIEGVIISKDNDDYGLRVVIETKDKKQVVLPSHKVLQNRLQGTKVEDYIKVVYKGEELPKVKGRNPTKIYKVFIQKA